MATITQPSQTMTWEQFQNSLAWTALSPARKVFVTAYLTNGRDELAAARQAYPRAAEGSRRCMVYELRKAPEVVSAIEFYNGGVTRELLIAEVRGAIRKAEVGSVAHQRLLSQLERLVFGIKPGPHEDEAETDPKPKRGPGRPRKETPTEAESPKFFVGQLVTQRDDAGIVHTGRVLSVDADGHPIDFEEVL